MIVVRKRERETVGNIDKISRFRARWAKEEIAVVISCGVRSGRY